jgi:hypothetical protein
VIYTDKIKPLLDKIDRIACEHDIPVIFTAQIEDEMRTFQSHPEKSVNDIHFFTIRKAIDSMGNIDILFSNIRAYCTKHRLSGSIFLHMAENYQNVLRDGS